MRWPPNPPNEPVNVNRMMLYSLIPIVSIWVGWRIQKFWVLFAINLGIGIVVGFIVPFPFNLLITIPVSVLMVRHFAIRYNNGLAASRQANIGA